MVEGLKLVTQTFEKDVAKPSSCAGQENEMDNEPKGGGPAAAIAAMVVCCGGMLLVATGVLTLSSVGAWLLDGGLVWLVVVAMLAAAGALLWRRRNTVEPDLQSKPQATRAVPDAERINPAEIPDERGEADKETRKHG